MLGWEYPPHISGGLGIATMGLAEAMGDLADVTLILPNQQQLNAQLPITSSEKSLEETTISGYQPYQSRTTAKNVGRSAKARAEVLYTSAKIKPSDIYGDALMAKVDGFAIQALKKAKTIDFDVIHAHDWMTFLAGLILRTWMPMTSSTTSTRYTNASLMKEKKSQS